MLKPRKSWILITGLCLLAAPLATAQDRVPGEIWERFASPEDAGFSSEELDEAMEFYETLDASAAMVVYDGAVLASWGEVERRFMCHSVRKSFMSGLWGVHVDRGDVDLSRTLAELGIDDMEPKLTDVEKRATILDLLKARSGVYRLAAYEPPQNPKPPRHSHEPGTFFCYNNWDFNTLVTIFQQEVGTEFFADFGANIADPIGMQDYRPRDGYLHYELEKSIHPAYPFRMSARDMARFGTLFLREGHWGDEVVLSEDWVERSRTSYSDSGRGGGYGLLWWIAGEKDLEALGMYSALGYGGHAIDVLPGANLVLAFRVNTFDGRQVSASQRKTLLRKILAARAGEGAEDPELTPLESSPRADLASAVAADLSRYVTEIPLPTGGVTRTYIADDGALVLEIPNRGSFDLVPLGDDRVHIGDVEREMLFVFDESGKVINLTAAPPAADFTTIDGILDELYASVSFGPGGECNWDRLREILIPGAIFVQPPQRGAERKVIDIEGFFADFREFIANSSVKETGFSERIAQRTTDQFGDIAHSYVIFEVRLDPKSPEPGARGMDSIQLVRIDDRWWVNSIITEFERPERPMPARFLGGDGE